MNRLIILGNGFDLAHGLPTSYRDFINDYWSKIKDSNHDDELISFEVENEVLFNNVTCLNDLSKCFIESNAKVKFKDGEIFTEFGNNYRTGKYPRIQILNYKNNFFKLINIRNVENWVDVENEYYKVLKNCLKEIDNSEVSLLNREFEQIKKLLEKYLQQNVNGQYAIDLGLCKEVMDILKLNYINSEKLERFYQEISKKDSDLFRKEFLIAGSQIHNQKSDYTPGIKFDHYFLSFNYTFTAAQYIQLLGIKTENLNEIHGSLFNSRNPINFGFGDEMDKFYQEIEEKDDNEYLKNIKSFQYLHTRNYKQLLDLIDSDKFQVYIMGHSCGLSDRILLNTIFEHDNCKSIKIYYHKKDDETDNYTEITQNISRHFNKKKLMREKIVNKTLCRPLPQIKLPLKQKNGSLS